MIASALSCFWRKNLTASGTFDRVSLHKEEVDMFHILKDDDEQFRLQLKFAWILVIQMILQSDLFPGTKKWHFSVSGKERMLPAFAGKMQGGSHGGSQKCRNQGILCYKFGNQRLQYVARLRVVYCLSAGNVDWERIVSTMCRCRLMKRGYKECLLALV